MRGSDFRHWYNWIKKNGHPFMTYDEAYNIYHNHYSCNCVSCIYRKANGFVPIPTLKTDCLCPSTLPVVEESLV